MKSKKILQIDPAVVTPNYIVPVPIALQYPEAASLSPPCEYS